MSDREASLQIPFTMNIKVSVLLLSLLLGPSIIYASSAPRLTPFEQIASERDALKIDVTDTDANELIPRILEQTGLQYTFIRSQEERLLSLKTKGDPALILETVVFAAGFNIHKNGNYWVIHPLAIEDTESTDSSP